VPCRPQSHVQRCASPEKDSHSKLRLQRRNSTLQRRWRVAFNSRIADNILRVGVNYKFDPNERWVDY
jgi:hypothetical protein